MSELERYNATLDTADQAQYFNLLVKQADLLAQSNILPTAYRRRPADIIAAGLAGRTFGWDVMTSLSNYHVIEGTASLRPEAMLGLVRRAGHSVSLSIGNVDGERCATAHGKRADNGDEHTAVFTTADAKVAGLVGKKNWVQYQDAMLTWRAVSALCRVLYPDVVMGAGYTPEEIGGPVPTANDDDPLGEVFVMPLEAKRALLERCDGDKELARQHWGDRPNEPLRVEELEALLAAVDQEEVVLAEIVEPEASNHPTANTRTKLGSKARKQEESDHDGTE